MDLEGERRYRAGDMVDDLCRACRLARGHRVIVADGSGRPLRVVCDFCGSQHNFRGGVREENLAAPAGEARTHEPAAHEPARKPERSPRMSEPDAGNDMARGTGGSNSPGEDRDLEGLLRRIIREEAGLTPVTPADRWRGGEMALRPGRPGLQEKTIPIETFFNKIVMIRNRLRVLEQQINASELPDDQKLRLQGHITGCYGSLTSFNIFFADDEDRFRGTGG